MANRLNISPGTTISGLLDFDGVAFVALDEDVSINGNRTVTFKLWLDKDSTYGADGLFVFGDLSADHLSAKLENSSLFFYSSSSGGGTKNRYLSITGLDNQILTVEVTKSESSIDQVKINGEIQSLLTTFTSENYSANSIGKSVAGTLSNATIWDINASGSTWKGYPGGNLNSAWEDQSGTNDGNVTGSPGTRSVSGFDPMSTTEGKKLIIKPSSLGKLYIGKYVIPSIFSFITDASTQEFDPVWFGPTGFLNWDLGDGSIVNGTNSIDHTYTQIGDKTVKVYQGTVSSLEEIDSIIMPEDNIKGTLDFSNFSGLSTLNFSGNSDVTGVSLPTTSNNFSFVAGSCDLTGTLDVSGLINLYQFSAVSNPNLTSILFPSNPSVSTSVTAYNCNLTGPVDVSGLDLYGQFTLASNGNMTQLLLPSVNTGAVTSFYLYGCGQCYGDDGVLDWSGWSDMGGQMHIGGVDVSILRFPTASTREWTSLNVYSTDVSILDFSNLVFHPTTGANILANNSPNLAQIIWPDEDVIIPSLNMSNCNFSGNLDLSSVHLGRIGYASGNLYLNGNEITQIIHKDSTAPLDYTAYSNDLTGTLDVSGLTGIYRYFRVNDNPNLCDILFPDFSDYWTTINVYDCSLSQFTVDDIFLKLDTYYTSNSPTSSLEVNTSGGTNMSPTDGTLNTNIQSLESIFTSTGQALTININE